MAALAIAVPAVSAETGSVAGRPALSTESAEKLIEQRSKWGTAPAPVKAAALPAAKPAKKPVAKKPAPKKKVAKKTTKKTD